MACAPRQAEADADSEARAQHDAQMRPGLGERWPDPRVSWLDDRVREHGVQEEARGGDGSNAEHCRDHDRRPCHVRERLAVQQMG
jgi:hypothetical protein